MKQISGKILELIKTQSLKMSFLATEDICHSNELYPGGFTTVMMDSCMAFLVMNIYLSIRLCPLILMFLLAAGIWFIGMSVKDSKTRQTMVLQS